MESISVSSKGQVVIPKNVRERLGIKAGSRLELTEAGGELRLRPVERPRKTATVAEGVGLAGYKGPRISLADMDRAVEEAVTERYLRSLRPAARKAAEARLEKLQSKKSRSVKPRGG